MVDKCLRAAFSTGKIHNLKESCPYVAKIKHGNWDDFYHWDEAETELKNRGKKAVRCSKCGWPKGK